MLGAPCVADDSRGEVCNGAFVWGTAGEPEERVDSLRMPTPAATQRNATPTTPISEITTKPAVSQCNVARSFVTKSILPISNLQPVSIQGSIVGAKVLSALVIPLARNERTTVKLVKKVLVVVAIGAATVLPGMAATDATEIATSAETAFAVVAPIVITIATFFVVVRIAKRVVK